MGGWIRICLMNVQHKVSVWFRRYYPNILRTQRLRSQSLWTCYQIYYRFRGSRTLISYVRSNRQERFIPHVSLVMNVPYSRREAFWTNDQEGRGCRSHVQRRRAHTYIRIKQDEASSWKEDWLWKTVQRGLKHKRTDQKWWPIHLPFLRLGHWISWLNISKKWPLYRWLFWVKCSIWRMHPYHAMRTLT